MFKLVLKHYILNFVAVTGLFLLACSSSSDDGSQDAATASIEPTATAENLEVVSQVSAAHVLKQQIDTTITFTSPVFNLTDPERKQKRIPKKHTCTKISMNDPNISPPIAWQGVPEDSKSIVLIMDSLEATGNAERTHWLMWNIPVTVTELPEGVPNTVTLQDGTVQGTNYRGSIGYLGPCPPPIVPRNFAVASGGANTQHQKQQQIQKYFFNLYALDIELDLDSQAKKVDLLQAIEGHIVAAGNLVGERQGKIMLKE